jgi:hypothetical protein
MRQSVTMRIDPAVLRAAKQKAVRDNRSLTNYVETLMRRDLQLGGADPTLQVIAPNDIRDWRSAPRPDETAEERKRRDNVLSAVLDASGH